MDPEDLREIISTYQKCVARFSAGRPAYGGHDKSAHADQCISIAAVAAGDFANFKSQLSVPAMRVGPTHCLSAAMQNMLMATVN
jgi:hypothetical protein